MASITVETIDDITVFKVVGAASFDEIAGAIQNYYPKTTFHIIWDLSNGSLDALSAEQFRAIVPIAKKYMSANRVDGKTVYVSSSDHIYGMLRMYATIAELGGMPYGYSVFRTFEEALEWLRKP